MESYEERTIPSKFCFYVWGAQQCSMPVFSVICAFFIKTLSLQKKAKVLGYILTLERIF